MNAAGRSTPGWWMQLTNAVDDLARRYPRTYGATIPASWREDDETVELLAAITTWRRELDRFDAAGDPSDDLAAEPLDFPLTPLERARQEWEWHAHRDHWLTRIGETGTSPLATDEATRS